MTHPTTPSRRFRPRLPALGAPLAALALAWGMTACTSPAPLDSGAAEQHSEIVLREGDMVRIGFPGAPNLDVPAQPIRRDGKISLPIGGEIDAAGLTPATQLNTREVLVTVVASSFAVFVDGMVLRPGKIQSDHPLTVLEAVMEAGGFEYTKADTKHVLVIRHTFGGTDYQRITLDVQSVIDGRQKALFYLQPGDVVHVPEKFVWF